LVTFKPTIGRTIMALFDKFRRLPATKPEKPGAPINSLTSALKREQQFEEQRVTPPQCDPDTFDDELAIPSFSPENSARIIEKQIVDGEELFLDREKLYNVEDDILALVDPKFAKEQVILPIERIGTTITVICASKQSQRVAEHVLSGQHKNLRFKFV